MARLRLQVALTITSISIVGVIFIFHNTSKLKFRAALEESQRLTETIATRQPVNSDMVDMEGLVYNKTLHDKINGKIYLKVADMNSKSSLEVGKQYLKKQTIAIAGAMRNVETNLETLKKNFMKMIPLAKNYSLLPVENDSKDNTRKGVLGWKKDIPNLELLGCKNVTQPCRIPMKRNHAPGGKGKNEWTFDGWTDRVKTMAKLRNLYLDRAIELKVDFLIVHEMDLMFNLQEDHLAKAFYLFSKFPHIDSLCAYGLTIFHRTWDVCTIVLPPITKWQTFQQGWEHLHFVEAVAKFKPEDRPVKVLSCFGGLAIYRMTSLKKYSARYTGPPPERTTCEHNMLSYKLKNNYIVPSMTINIGRNLSE